ncbi:MAG: hypothetical protein ABL952_01220 [Pyrinomonadaceae bacterium]
MKTPTLKAVLMQTPDMRVSSISHIPKVPAIYAMLGGSSSNLYVAYVGMGDDLKQRLAQHFLRRDSSAVTGTSAVSLNPELITQVNWWSRDEFSIRTYLEAAELYAFKLLNPVMRSRGRVSKEAMAMSETMDFEMKIAGVFLRNPSGVFVPTSVMAKKMSELETRLAALEKEVALMRKSF